MIIIDRKTFLSLPENTLYADYEPCVFGPLMIKMETLSTNDWCEQSITDAISSTGSSDLINKLEAARLFNVSLDMDFDCCGRNGCFESDDKLFAVFEKKDISKLINRLSECL